MPNSPDLNFNVIDETLTVSPALTGINGMLLDTPRGPYGKPDTVITSFTEFQKLYGYDPVNYPDTIAAKRALERGSSLRINKVGSAGTPAVKAAQDANFEDASTNELFQLLPKYAGAAYNDMVVSIKASSNGNANYFDLVITYTDGDLDLSEVYQNLTIPGTPTVAESKYLDRLVRDSKLVDVTYLDLSGLTAPINPAVATVGYENGTNGAALVAADYTAALVNFTDYDDIFAFGAVSMTDDTYNAAAGNYAANRKDLMAYLYLGTDDSDTDLITKRTATSLDTEFAEFFAGEIIIPNPDSTGPATIATSPMGDIIGNSGKTDAELGPWWSFAGPKRGTMGDAIGVTHNFGPDKTKMDLLANRQINMIIVRNNKVMQWGNFTAQLALSQKSYGGIVKLTIYLQKSLGPTLETFMEDPLDLKLVRQMHDAVKPFLDGLKSPEARALFDYKWDGDQNASSIDGLVVNEVDDFQLGKYKVNLFIKAINALQELEINIILSRASVEFNS